jgi:hypothetical protein
MSSAAPAAIYGIAAEFASPEALYHAAEAIARAGFTRVEAYSPFSIRGLAEVLGARRNTVALATLIAGMIGGLTGFGMCWYAYVVFYPLNVGGRPFNSWPAWIPITFELTVLFAALTAAISMIVLNGLPRLHHPVFNIPNFERASHDRFFLCVEARDPHFDAVRINDVLREQMPLAVTEVFA